MALLTLAQLQPDRFEGGWVTVEDLARSTTIGVHLSNVRRALDRARKALGDIPELRTMSDTRGRKTVMRLVSPVPAVLLQWFQDLGRSYLLPGSGVASTALAVTMSGGGRQVSDAIGELLHSTRPIAQLEAHLLEAASRKGEAEGDAQEWTHEARLLLATTEIVLDRAGADLIRTLRSALESHLTRMSADGPHDLVIAEAQCAIALARCVVRGALLNHPTWPLGESQASECREWLTRAAPIMTSLPLQDRGDGMLLEAALVLHDASARRVTWPWACDAIETHLARASECFRLSRDVRGLTDVLILRAELMFHMFIREPEWPNRIHSHETGTALAILRAVAELLGRPDAWVIARARAVMLKIGIATREFRADERTHTAVVLDEAAREIISLSALATESSLPYVSHARDFLTREASAIKIALPTLDVG